MIKELIKAFEYGADYGLLLAEQERDGDLMGDAMVCASLTNRHCVPVYPTNTSRAPRSDKWRQSKKDSFDKFIGLIVSAEKDENDKEVQE